MDEQSTINLRAAIVDKDVEALKRLIADGADPTERDEYGRSYLMTACERENVEIVKCLLELAHMSVSEIDKCGWTPLMVAASVGNLSVVKHLVSVGACLHTRNALGETVLHLAAQTESIETFQFLQKSGAEIDSRDIRGRTVLHSAADFAFPDMVQLILEGGWASVDCKDKFGQTPLMLTAGFPRHEKHGVIYSHWLDPENNYVNKVIRLLLDAGADLTLMDVLGRTALHAALINKRNLEYLLERCPDFVNAVDKKGENPIMISVQDYCYYNDTDRVCEFLTEEGTDTNFKSEDGRTVLSVVAEMGNTWCFNCLLKYGAKLSGCQKDSLSRILHTAVWRMDYKLVETLIAGGADVNFREDSTDSSCEGDHTCFCLSAEDSCWSWYDGPCGQSPIFKAVKHVKMVRILIDAGADVNIKEAHHGTPLQAALKCSAPCQVLEMLLEAGANPNAVDICGVSYLHCVPEWLKNVKKQRKVCLKFCEKLISAGAKVDAVDHHGRTPLHYASVKENLKSQRHFPFSKILINAGARVDAKDNDGRTPLHYAVKDGNIKFIKLLISAGADVNAEDINNMTPLLISTNGSYDKELIDAGANLKAKDINGRTALHRAAEDGNEFSVEYLTSSHHLEWGCDKDGNNVLHSCTKNQKQAANCMLHILMKKIVSVDEKNANGHTALSLIVQHLPYFESAKDSVKLLLEAGANATTVDNQGNTPLHFAVLSEDVQAVELLIAAGADIAARNAKGELPLHCAAQVGCMKLLDLLLRVGKQHKAITVDERDSEGRTALMHAVQHRDTADFLLKEGADISMKDHEGRTALQAAVDQGNFQTTKLLWAAGGDFMCLPEASRVRAIHLTVKAGDFHLLKNLVSLGLSLADSWWDPEHKSTLLHCAAESSLDILKYLKETGIIPLEQVEQTNALLCAVNSTNAMTVKYLLEELKAPIDIRDEHGRTALMLVAETPDCWPEKLTLFHVLLEGGADINAQDKQGRSIYQIAEEARQLEFCRILTYMKYRILSEKTI